MDTNANVMYTNAITPPKLSPRRVLIIQFTNLPMSPLRSITYTAFAITSSAASSETIPSRQLARWSDLTEATQKAVKISTGVGIVGVGAGALVTKHMGNRKEALVQEGSKQELMDRENQYTELLKRNEEQGKASAQLRQQQFDTFAAEQQAKHTANVKVLQQDHAKQLLQYEQAFISAWKKLSTPINGGNVTTPTQTSNVTAPTTPINGGATAAPTAVPQSLRAGCMNRRRRRN